MGGTNPQGRTMRINQRYLELDGSLIFKPEKLRFQTTRTGSISLSLFPEPPLAVKAVGLQLNQSQDGVFTDPQVSLAGKNLPLSVELRKIARSSRKVPLGPAGVAQAPLEADFEMAQVHHLNFPVD